MYYQYPNVCIEWADGHISYESFQSEDEFWGYVRDIEEEGYPPITSAQDDASGHIFIE